MPSTATLTGAMAAIEARLAANWTATPIVYDNIDPDPDPADGTLVDGVTVPMPWVFVELIDVAANIIAFGLPGDQTVLDEGLLKLHVMVEKGAGMDDARLKAEQLGEIFRQKEFYNTDPTAYVRTMTPRVGRGSMVSENGNWVSMHCTVPYQFYRRA
jgi:hypothetical protein